MPVLIVFLVVVGASFVAVIHRLLAHKERMAEIEAKRPRVVLQLPEAPLLGGGAEDELTDQILAACQARGIDVDLEIGR